MPFSFSNLFSKPNYNQNNTPANKNLFSTPNNQYKNNNPFFTAQNAFTSNNNSGAVQNPFVLGNNRSNNQNPFVPNIGQKNAPPYNPQAAKTQNQPQFSSAQGFANLFNQGQNKQPSQNLQENMKNMGNNMKGQNPSMSNLPPFTPNGLENPFSASLPDGVTLQPLGEDIFKNLQNLAPAGILPKKPENLPQTPLQPTEIFQNRETSNVNNEFGTFIQNERNGAIYYKNLAAHSPIEYKNLIQEISSYCETRQNSFNKLYKEQNGNDFPIREAEILQGKNFRKSISLAIEEESRNIRELIKLFEKTSDLSVSKILNGQIYEKMADMSLLNMILSLL